MAVASAVVDDESTSLYGSAGTVDTINYDVKKSLLDKLTQLRRKLFGGHRLDEVVTTRLKSIHRAIKFGLGFADSNPDKGSQTIANKDTEIQILDCGDKNFTKKWYFA